MLTGFAAGISGGDDDGVGVSQSPVQAVLYHSCPFTALGVASMELAGAKPLNLGKAYLRAEVLGCKPDFCFGKTILEHAHISSWLGSILNSTYEMISRGTPGSI